MQDVLGHLRQRVQLLQRGDDFVIGVAELVATRAVIFVAELVGGDLKWRAEQLSDELAVVDVVGRGEPEIAARRRIADLARLDRIAGPRS